MIATSSLPLDPLDAARAAGLRHVDPDATAGLSRVRRGQGFVYVDPSGRPVRDPATLARIRKLAVPPAWRAVWISPSPESHIQAVGRDARGRKQYRYHERWRQVRDATKYHKMLAFSRALPRIRAACDRDLAQPGLPRDKVLAAVVRLLDLTHVRVGNEEYTRDNGSYGLTTLRDWHVTIEGCRVRFRFRGKAGKVHDIGVHDRRLARVVAMCAELPGHELFQYLGDSGATHAVDSGDVNEYLRAAAGDDFTAKDFRTWAGTVLAATRLRARAEELRRAREAPTAARSKRGIVECVAWVAAQLGNTPAVCKRCYIHPAVLDAFREGSLDTTRPADGERLVREILRRAARHPAADDSGVALRRALRASLRVRTRQAVRGGVRA